ncbi:hypothetical protein ACFPME_01785 [Rhodanobacter umsongensis]|uniref:DUF2933 domain-containing protein n=1 Tax=Rhodanobacter umsongensis TaxID=633153 RepID=A0ABW0JH68_9GAMM
MRISHVHAGTCHAGHGNRSAAGRGVAGWLALAATPTFALMAVLAGAHDGGPMDMPCSAAHGASPLSGMIPMYVLMSVFHGGPWLRWIAERRRQRTGGPAADG